MATAAGYFDRKPAATSRPGLSHLQGDPASPHTPQRTFSSAFSSPALSYRAEEEVVVIELGARHLSAGIVGESNPRCRLRFGPERSRRVGDYREHLPEYQERPRKRRRNYKWGEDHELWRMDLRDVDLGLVEDKIERTLREAYTKYLLLDSKNKRLVLILPSLLPHRLLSSILSSIFSNFQMPSITLFSSPVLNVAAAGCRAGLVVDIGWDETVVTGIYEHREVQTRWTTRAMKVVTQRTAVLLHQSTKPDDPSQQRPDPSQSPEDKKLDEPPPPDSRYFEFSEEVTSRIAWCPVTRQDSPHSEQKTNSGAAEAHDDSQDGTTIDVPSPLPPHKTLQIPFAKLAEPVEYGLLAKGSNLHNLDDDEQSLPQLIYKSLLSLPPDVRSQCMARIVITGEGSNIAGLKTRLLNEVKAIVDARGWDPVYGKVAVEAKQHVENTRGTRNKGNLIPSAGADTHLQPQIKDEMTEKLEQDRRKNVKATVVGEIRGVETLGAWAGGSLVASLKVKGVVEIDRDSFLTNGLAGAKKESEVVQATQRMSLGARSGLGEKSGWTLGAWA